MTPFSECENLAQFAMKLIDTLPDEVQRSILKKHPNGVRVFAADLMEVNLAGAIGDMVILRPQALKTSTHCLVKIIYHEYAHIYAFASGLDSLESWLGSDILKQKSERIARELEETWTKLIYSDEERKKRVVAHIESFSENKLYFFCPALKT